LCHIDRKETSFQDGLTLINILTKNFIGKWHNVCILLKGELKFMINLEKLSVSVPGYSG